MVEAVFLVLILLLLACYFLPTLFAWGRGHHNALAIFALNLLFGWTFIGWAAALIWSLTAVREPVVVSRSW